MLFAKTRFATLTGRRTRSRARCGIFEQSFFQFDQALSEFRNSFERCGLAHSRDLGGAVKLGQSEMRRVRLNPEIDRSITNFAHVVGQGLEDAKQCVESAGV